MLLLILFAGCLASCAAQTTSFPSTMGISTTGTMTPFPQSVQTTADPHTPDSTSNTVAILQTAVQSIGELNGTATAQILNELQNIIQKLGQNATFSLNIKNITKV